MAIDDDTDVRDLPLSAHVKRALLSAGFRTWGQVHPLRSRLWSIKGIGFKREQTLHALLRQWDAAIVTEQDLDNPRPPALDAVQAPEPTDEQIAHIKQQTRGYGAAVTWPDEIIKRAFQAGWQAAFLHSQQQKDHDQ